VTFIKYKGTVVLYFSFNTCALPCTLVLCFALGAHLRSVHLPKANFVPRAKKPVAKKNQKPW